MAPSRSQTTSPTYIGAGAPTATAFLRLSTLSAVSSQGTPTASRIRTRRQHVGTSTTTIRQPCPPDGTRLHVGALLALELRHPSGRGSRHELRPQAGSRLESGRPALGYLSGVSPQVDADVAEARDVIHNSSIQGAGLYEMLAPSGRSVVLGPCGARSPCYLFLSPPGGAPGALSETRPRVLLLLGGPSRMLTSSLQVQGFLCPVAVSSQGIPRRARPRSRPVEVSGRPGTRRSAPWRARGVAGAAALARDGAASAPAPPPQKTFSDLTPRRPQVGSGLAV